MTNMGFGFEDRKSTLLYADLFKPTQCGEGWSTSSNNESSSFDSSSSSSELGSEDGDFIAELSRQMAECMLQEEDEEEEKFKYDQVGVRRQVVPGRRVMKEGELTQQMEFQKREQNYGRNRGRKRQVGPGMRAVFLGGPGSRNGSSGTGVFLPRVANQTVEPKKKPGLSTVLIPTRVLEALELHFNRFSDSATQPFMTTGSPHQASPTEESKRQEKRDSKFKIEGTNKDDEMQRLPKEWTY